MNFDCDQRNSVHFIYTLPFKKNRMLVETTWFSKYDKKLFDYQKQIDQWLWQWMRLKKSDYKIKYTEQGAIPLFPVKQKNKKADNYSLKSSPMIKGKAVNLNEAISEIAKILKASSSIHIDGMDCDVSAIDTALRFAEKKNVQSIIKAMKK